MSRLQFDSVTEQLNTMFHELLNKLTGHEQDWHKVIDKLSTEMECKVDIVQTGALFTVSWVCFFIYGALTKTTL